MKKYRSLDERVFTRILNNSDASQEFISRTQARYGLMSVSSPEFDDILARYKIETHYNPRTHGQQYRIKDIAAALATLLDTYRSLEKGLSPFGMEGDQ